LAAITTHTAASSRQRRSKDFSTPSRAAISAGSLSCDTTGQQDYKPHYLSVMNHLFQSAGTGAPSEYGEIEETLSPSALEAITKWIRGRTGRAAVER